MPTYNFKSIQVVPSAADFVEIVLSRTQRKTPTVIHKAYGVPRIRQFYMRKVKYTQQTYHEKISKILEDFPKLDDLHPFYGDLLNVIYDRDHYKLALGQLNTARHLIDVVAKDYVRMLKYGDSMYRCKQLKRAALGRMCTIMKKQKASLDYLEQVRQHLSRLPSIDPSTRTLILCGYPNVGKSSFMNNVTRAEVEVQPYAFTTKSLFVGHTDYQYMSWQVIDTPGILDHPLEERNVIEMQSITALAHLRAAVLYLIDISEQCGYSLEQQVSLFQSIKPLFANKPLLVVANKTDVMPLEQLPPHKRALIDSIVSPDVDFLAMSTLTTDGVETVKSIACRKLLNHRVTTALRTQKSLNTSKIHLAEPRKRDNKDRPVFIPETYAQKLEQEPEDMEVDLPKFTKAELEAMQEEDWKEVYANGIIPFMGDQSQKDGYLLANDEWKYDKIPEIINGHNIIDFLDPEIMSKLDALEKEEEELMRLEEAQGEDEGSSDLDEEEEDLLRKLRRKKSLLKTRHRTVTDLNRTRIPRKIASRSEDPTKLEGHLKELGIDEDSARRARSNSRQRASRSRERSLEPANHRPRSKTPVQKGFKNDSEEAKARKIKKKDQRGYTIMGRAGESDRHIHETLPRHLFAGKRGIGKTDRR